MYFDKIIKKSTNYMNSRQVNPSEKYFRRSSCYYARGNDMSIRLNIKIPSKFKYAVPKNKGLTR